MKLEIRCASLRDLIFVDHLQLLSNTKDPTTNAYLPHDPAVSYDLKRLAVSLDCTVVALSRMESEDVHPVIQGADMTAVLKTGYNLIEEKIKALEKSDPGKRPCPRSDLSPRRQLSLE